MKILKGKKASVTIELHEDELEALVTLMGNMSTNDDMKFGVSREQADLLYLIYCELSDYVDDK